MVQLKALACALALTPAVAMAAPPAPPAGNAGPKPPPPPPPPPSLNNVNPYVGPKAVFANKGYAQKLEATIDYFNQQGDSLNAAKTRTVQKVPTFWWISSSGDLPNIGTVVADALAAQRLTKKKQLVQLVVYNLPDRDCSAKSSDGEFKLDQDGLNKYKGFVDTVAGYLTTPEAKQLEFSLVLEPDSLANTVTNLNVEKCADAASSYKNGIAYAIATLQQPNIALYLDAAHGGWLGWADNLAPSAAVFAEVLSIARTINPNASVRGLATDVSNYNQFVAPVRENFTEYNPSWDETHYVTSLAPYLEAAGYPAHFIVDQGRSGKAGIRQEWSQWCNVRNAGYGQIPTADQALINNTYVDALVWVKPGGESDGTSDPTAARFDTTCVSAVAHVPAPEAGQWFNDYVVNLVKNANPPLEPTYV